MALQNIGAGNKDDAFYRYKMPRMITKIEGRGNGIKTNIVNMVDIAKALSRPASYTTKYFGCELGAQSKFEEKTGTSHVNGAHETSKLAGLLENFIKKYVQCYGCGNPETEIIITKSQMITLKCAACGFLSDVDMRDKLNTFILKNPPEQKKGSGKDKKAMRRAEKERLKEGEAADEELKKLKKDATKKKGLVKTSPQGSQEDEIEASASAVVEDEDDNDDEGDDVEWQTDTSAEAARQRIQEQLSAVTAGMVMISTNEEKPKSAANGRKLVSSINEYLKKGSTATQFKSFVESLPDKPKDIMDALFESLFGGVGKGSLSKEVVKKKNYLAAVCGLVGEEEEGSQQMLLLEAIETFCGKTSRDAVKEVALVLKALYDIDVLEEEYVVEWYEKGIAGSNKGAQIWKNVKPFVEWLQSAESESEEE